MIYKSSILKEEIWKLDIDLVADLNNLLYQRLVREEYRNVDPDRAMYQYFNARKRMVAAKPRKVHKSKEFQCPGPYRTALSNFEAMVEKGQPLKPFLSDKLLDASYSDGMLNDWNIYHFHLTNRFKENGWAKRSDYELFAHVTDTDMYFIQVYEHKNPLLYWQKDILRIINDNWPELLENFHIKGAVRLTEKIGDAEYKILREAHISTMVELDENQVFGLMGGGYMSDGSSGEAMMASNRWHNRLRQIELLVKNSMGKLCELIASVSDVRSIEYNIRLLWIDSEFEFTFGESKHQVVIQLNLREGYWRVCKPAEVFGYEKYKYYL